MSENATTITLTINGKPQQLDGCATLADLVEHLKLDRSRIAVERNKQIVRKSDYANTALTDGDRLEIVTLVGGG